MEELIARFQEQIEEALEIGTGTALSKPERELENVVIAGLGGSGIGGSLVQGLVRGEARIPVAVNKGYFLPRYADRATLVIISSYSGNTEETISVFRQALERGSRIFCITSGGEIKAMAKENNIDVLQIPAGMPPRAALAYSFVFMLFVLKNEGLISSSLIKGADDATRLLESEEESIQSEARLLAESLHGKTPVIYAEDTLEAVAVRFRQQLNENSKVLAWHHVIPEMNHNELVGWRDNAENLAVVILRNESEYERNQKRIGINMDILRAYTGNITEVWAKGFTPVEQFIYLIHLTDWVSVYLAALRGMDAMEVKVIDYLKGELGKAE